MLSLGAMKDGVIRPSEEDRKRIITQMKVRTTLKGDKSWIQQRSDSEEKPDHRPLVACTAPSSQGEPQSPSAQKNLPQKSPGATSSSGYLIRGVFTKTIDKSSPSKTVYNGTQKSAKSSSQTSSSQGHKLSTEDYKKLAPYNIKHVVSHPGDGELSVSPEEQKKRTQAASSVLRRTAGRERSYVLSAAKKSGGSPTQEVPAFVAKRIDVEDDIGPRSRSQTVPASAWFSSRGKSSTNGEGKTAGSPCSEPRSANISVRTSIDTNNSINVASKPYLETSFNHSRSMESSNKSDQEKHETISGHDSALRIPTSPKRSEENELQSSKFFDKSALEHKQGLSNGEGKHKDLTAAEFCKYQPITEKENTEASSGTGYSTSVHLDNSEGVDSKRSEPRPGESSLSTTGIQCELLSTAKREESDVDITSLSYYPFREPGTSFPKSHRVPFYKDICDTESGRNLADADAKDATASSQLKNPPSYDSDSSTSGKGLLFVKESIKSMELSSSPRYNSRSLVDLSELEKPSYSSASYLNNTPPKRPLEDVCTYCGRIIRNCAKISIENLNICCHEYCFRCGICHKPMGDLLDKIFIHRDIVHCDKCYEKLF
ncbi:zinc finger protein 185 [Candoia aspera]|uniref:zinc finger protein 185 n=1 Tax=Candoia aspera TaxID=51853 RepID=UPI002FD7C4E9